MYEDVRGINHVLINNKAMYPQTVYRMLGNLQAAGYGLREVIDHLARMLKASLDEYDVREDDGTDPGQNNAAAVAELRLAASAAAVMAERLSEAQNLIATQSGRTRGDGENQDEDE